MTYCTGKSYRHAFVDARVFMGGLEVGALFAKAALAAVELDDDVLQVLARHLGPQLVHEDELCVRDLEQQEVADAQLARRANEDVRVRQAAATQRTDTQALAGVPHATRGAITYAVSRWSLSRSSSMSSTLVWP